MQVFVQFICIYQKKYVPLQHKICKDTNMIKDLNITIESIPLNFYEDNLKCLAESDFPFTAESFKSILSSGIHECFFQNREKDKKGKTCYTVFVRLYKSENEHFVRMHLVLNEDVVCHQPCYLFFVPEIQFVNHLPKADAIHVQCSFNSVYGKNFKPLDSNIGQLLTEIDNLPIPSAEINKERDKQIWDTYLRALRQYVFQKERIWKVKDININKKLILIQHDEPELLKQEISRRFHEEGLKPIYATNEIAYIPFNGEHLLSEDERNELIDIAERYSYKIEENSPQKLLKCRITFNQNDQRRSINEKILNNLRRKNYSHISSNIKDDKPNIEIRFHFRDAEQRDHFVSDLCSECREQNCTAYFLDGEEGVTQYVLKRDQKLLDNQEKLIAKNFTDEKFIFYNQEELDRYQKLLELKGEGAQVPDGLLVGTFIKKNGDSFVFNFSDEFINKLDELGSKKLLESGGYIRPVFAGELATIRRMQHAMNKIIRPFSEGYPANWNLANFIFDPEDIREPLMDIESANQQILSNPLEQRILNQPKQIEAVAKAIAAQDLTIIQGPPGTGKTTVIAEIIWQTICLNPNARILITSQTNLAVDNAIARLAGKRNVFPIRSGLLERFEDEGKAYSYERISRWINANSTTQEQECQDNVIRKWMIEASNSSDTTSALNVPISAWKNALMGCPEALKMVFYDAYMNNVNVIGATCSESGSTRFAALCSRLFKIDKDKDPIFDLVIMDEASKATPPELILPLTLGKKVVIIGDHKQLPPMIDSKDFAEAMDSIGAKHLADELSKKELKMSQFERLFVNAPDFAKVSLDTQFRMHEKIMNCIKQFYADQKELENGLICGIQNSQDIPNLTDKGSRYHGLTCKPFITPDTHAIWIDVKSPERKREGATSFYNEGEVSAVKTILHMLIKADGIKEYMDSCTSAEEKEIGVITYYAAQKNELKNALKDIDIPLRVNTVDKFQGMERNIVIVSTVRSNRSVLGNNKEQPNEFELGFAKELQRINVGFSRAKRLLIVVGNKSHFEKNKEEYKNAIKQMECISINTLQSL